MFNKLNADELSELQERLFSGWTKAIGLSMLVEDSMFWQGVKPMERQLESLYREVSDTLGLTLLRQPPKMETV